MTSQGELRDGLGKDDRKPTSGDVFRFIGLVVALGVVGAALVVGYSFLQPGPEVTEVTIDSERSLFVATAPNRWRNHPSGSEKISSLFGATYQQLGFEAKDRGKRVRLVDTLFADSTWIEIMVEWEDVSRP